MQLIKDSSSKSLSIRIALIEGASKKTGRKIVMCSRHLKKANLLIMRSEFWVAISA
jgi:hypothetical protein